MKPYPFHPLRSLTARVTKTCRSSAGCVALFGVVSGLDLASYLGIVSVAGLAVLIGVLFLPRPPSGTLKTLWPISRLGMATLLIGMPYGLGHLFGMFVTTKIRAYGRLSFDLAFFAILALSLVVDHFLRRFQGHGRYSRMGHIGLALHGSASVDLSKCLRHSGPTIRHCGKSSTPTREFYRKIQECLPTNAMIFQLPHVAFAHQAIAFSHSAPPFPILPTFAGAIFTPTDCDGVAERCPDAKPIIGKFL